ncbi:MAG: hypothetical protein AAGJ94_06835 [Pseudomonadota bacterium]
MTEQLALDLGTIVAPPATIVSKSNEAAYGLLHAWPRWPMPIVLVSGPPGSGKSHLAAAFADHVGADHVCARSLSAGQAVGLGGSPLVVDDADLADDRALFHLFNAVRSGGSTLLLTATRRQTRGLADLTSRLRAVPEVALGPPDDALLKEVLREGLLRRQLAADPQVVNFLLSRIERTLHEAQWWVSALDRKGLAEQRAATRPLAAQILRASSGSRRDETVP